MTKILVIRMLQMGDVASIGLPAIRHIQTQNPDAELHFLTHAIGAEIIKLAEPTVHVLSLQNHIWPDNIFQAMEAFIGLAEDIIALEFDQIINLDTAFMPCFLARFIKDAGEPVSGNFISLSIQSLFKQIQQKTLQHDYVNSDRNYLQSTFFNMFKWHTNWWQDDIVPVTGYPEFYLKNCCGFADIEMDIHIDVSSQITKNNNTSIYIALDDPENPYSDVKQLQSVLEEKGYDTYLDNEKLALKTRLGLLKSCDLLVCLPNALFAFANAVDTPTLLLSKDLDPKMLMPDFAIEQSLIYPEPIDLADSIESIFSNA